MIIGRDGRKRSHTLPPRADALGRQAQLPQAQAAIGGRTDEVTDPLVDNVLKPLYAAYEALKEARATRAARSTSICPSGKSCSRPTARSIASSRRSGWSRTG